MLPASCWSSNKLQLIRWLHPQETGSFLAMDSSSSSTCSSCSTSYWWFFSPVVDQQWVPRFPRGAGAASDEWRWSKEYFWNINGKCNFPLQSCTHISVCEASQCLALAPFSLFTTISPQHPVYSTSRTFKIYKLGTKCVYRSKANSLFESSC